MLGVIEYFAKLLKVIVNGNIRKPGCGFLFAFHSNYGPVFYHFRDKARYWSKITIFFTSPSGQSPVGRTGQFLHVRILRSSVPAPQIS